MNTETTQNTTHCGACGGNGKKDGSAFKHARPCKRCMGTGRVVLQEGK